MYLNPATFLPHLKGLRFDHVEITARRITLGLVHMTDVLGGRKYFRVMLKKRFRIYELYAASVGQFVIATIIAAE